jgi:hypothetical protein
MNDERRKIEQEKEGKREREREKRRKDILASSFKSMSE